MNVTNSARSAGERREVVVEVLAQAVLDLVLRGRDGAERRQPPGARHDDAACEAAAGAPAEVADARG